VKFASIIWDWNGTLLDDVGIAISVINKLLTDRTLNPITLHQYLELFTFPVRDYYELIGFDLINEPFEIPAFQFITGYNSAVETCGLHREAIPLLNRLKDLGCRQFILSAMEQQQLEKTVSDCGISLIFEDLCGLSNHFATSKMERGKLLIMSRGLNPGLTLMIGDTVHDYEVAQETGCSCVLIAKGHQSKERLRRCGAKVLDSLSEIEFL
jgi:phosphoglycolate phosphatase